MLTSPGALAAKMKGFLLTTLLTLSACCPTTPAERAEPVPREPSMEAPPSVAQAPAPVAADPGPPRFTLRGETFTLGSDHPYPACDQPEQWLTFVRPAEFQSAYCDRCGQSTWCSPDSGDESGGPWSFASPAREPKDGFWCNELRYVRHAVGAELGVPVPPGRFARHFGYQRGYSPQPGMTEADLPSAARENLAWLGGLLDQCDASGQKLTAEDQRIVDAWFDANYAGRLKLPKDLYDNCNRMRPNEMRRVLGAGAYRRYSARTPVVRREAAGCQIAVPPRGRVISVHVGASLTGESCTECEGHEIMQLVLNAKGQIVALGVFLSG